MHTFNHTLANMRNGLKSGVVGLGLGIALLSLSSLFSAPSYADGKITGRIDLAITDRPAMPAAIVWSLNIQNAADAALAAKNPPGVAAPNSAAWIGVNFSRHHIIPQKYLQALYQMTLAPDQDIKNDDDKKQLVRSLEYIQAAGYPALATGSVVWAPVNLFEGPTGVYRRDDPGSKPELKKPKSFDETRWAALQKVVTALEKVGRLNANGDRFEIDAKKLNKDAGFVDLVSAVTALARLTRDTHPNPQAFLNTDWIDKESKALNLGNLIGFFNNAILTNQIIESRKSVYSLK